MGLYGAYQAEARAIVQALQDAGQLDAVMNRRAVAMERDSPSTAEGADMNWLDVLTIVLVGGATLGVLWVLRR